MISADEYLSHSGNPDAADVRSHLLSNIMQQIARVNHRIQLAVICLDRRDCTDIIQGMGNMRDIRLDLSSLALLHIRSQ